MNISLCNKTKIGRTTGRKLCLGFKLIPLLMKINFLIPKAQRFSVISESYYFKSQYLGLKFDRFIDTCNGEYKVVQVFNFHI